MKHKDIYSEIDRCGLPEIPGFHLVACGIEAAVLCVFAWVMIIV